VITVQRLPHYCLGTDLHDRSAFSAITFSWHIKSGQCTQACATEHSTANSACQRTETFLRLVLIERRKCHASVTKRRCSSSRLAKKNKPANLLVTGIHRHQNRSDSTADPIRVDKGLTSMRGSRQPSCVHSGWSQQAVVPAVAQDSTYHGDRGAGAISPRQPSSASRRPAYRWCERRARLSAKPSHLRGGRG
jgi:hypothetical protein